MKFKGLESLTDSSSNFTLDDEFKSKRIPNEEVYSEFVKYLRPEGISAGETMASSALFGYFFDVNENIVDRLTSYILEHTLTRFENAKRQAYTACLKITFHLSVAVASNLKQGHPPEAGMIKLGLIEMVARFEREKRTISHVAEIAQLMDSIFAAFLAHDLESVERLLAIRKNTKTYPYMDALARDMFKCASYQVINGKNILRFNNPAVREKFLLLFDAHRDWKGGRFMATFPGEYTCFLASPFLASYCLAWIYLQSFASEPVFQISKADMRLILTDTYA
jgi:hypothetical protein